MFLIRFFSRRPSTSKPTFPESSAELKALMTKGSRGHRRARQRSVRARSHQGRGLLPLAWWPSASTTAAGQLIVATHVQAEETSSKRHAVVQTARFRARGGAARRISAWKCGIAVEVIQGRGIRRERGARIATRGGRLAPPAAVSCDRNQLTSYAGRSRLQTAARQDRARHRHERGNHRARHAPAQGHGRPLPVLPRRRNPVHQPRLVPHRAPQGGAPSEHERRGLGLQQRHVHHRLAAGDDVFGGGVAPLPRLKLYTV